MATFVRAMLSTGSAPDSGTACDDQRRSDLRTFVPGGSPVRTRMARHCARPGRDAGGGVRRRRARPCPRNAAAAPASALRAELPDALRRAGADQMVRGAGHLPLLLLQL